MAEHKRVYPTQCMTSRRPEYRTGEPEFYRCGVCGAVEVKYRSFTTQGEARPGTCCGRALVRLESCADEVLAAEHRLDYCIFGGFAHNAVRVEVSGGLHPMGEDHRIEWIYLRTFQGGQMKYLPPRGPSAALFAMAEEDAFVFCDREVCRMGWERCLFQCKRDHIAYAYCSRHGLFRLRF